MVGAADTSSVARSNAAARALSLAFAVDADASTALTSELRSSPGNAPRGPSPVARANVEVAAAHRLVAVEGSLSGGRARPGCPEVIHRIISEMILRI